MKLSNLNRKRPLLLLAGALVATLMASCGGGEQVQRFIPSRVIAFGDESSVIRDDGSKYTVNALASGSTATIDCAGNPIWVQIVTGVYGLTYPQCPGSNIDPVSRIYATVGARVADIGTQIDTRLGDGGFTSGDLVTVMAGANDIIDQFSQYPAVGEDQLQANAQAAGIELAAQVNRLAGFGAKVLISTIPDMGLTPLAGDRSFGSTNGDPGVLSRLTTRFNDALLSHLLNDGHKIGLIQIDEYITAVDRQTQSGNLVSYANTTLAACQSSAPLPRCTTNTLVPDAVGFTWLWADDRHFGPTGQSALGSLAVTRAQNNPF